MKKIFILLLISSILCSCKVFYGENYDDSVKKLELGMSKKEVLHIMGNNYVIQNSSSTPDGNIEILLFNTIFYSNYALVFLDGELIEINNIPPRPNATTPTQQQNIIVN